MKLSKTSPSSINMLDEYLPFEERKRFYDLHTIQCSKPKEHRMFSCTGYIKKQARV